MARINQKLFERLKDKLGVKQSRIYKIIDDKVRSASLPRHLAAIAVAAENGINISKYANSEDLSSIRQATSSAAPPPILLQTSISSGRNNSRLSVKSKRAANTQQRRGTTVFVVHGRDLAARDAVFSFLRALGLRPLEWTQALKLTKKGTPYVGEVLDAAFSEAAAIVVLLTPDDEARLKSKFASPRDKDECKLTGQARPNVLFESGMAFGKNPNSTILVQLGDMRPFSDIGGRHVLQLNNSPASRNEFAVKLFNAGCIVDKSGSDWLKEGNFQATSVRVNSAVHTRRKQRANKP